MLELRGLSRRPGIRKNRGAVEAGEGQRSGSSLVTYKSPTVHQVRGTVPQSHPSLVLRCWHSPGCPDREGNRDSVPYIIHPRSHSLSEEQPGSQPRPGGPQWLPLAARKSSSRKNRSGVGAFSRSSPGSPEVTLLSSALSSLPICQASRR